jgi:toxin FitB
VIVLDTNVLSEPLRPQPNPTVLAWLDAQAVETLYLTSVSLAELRFGIAALPPGRRRQTLHDRLEGDVLPVFADRTLSFDAQATLAYAALRAEARAAGRAIGDFDALIAAIAQTHGFAVATRDGAPFHAAGIDVIDPFE